MSASLIIQRLCAVAIVIALAGAAAPAPPKAEGDRRVRIINDTRHVIVKFFASNAAAAAWQEDILRRGVLAPGQSVVVTVDDGSGSCLFDFRAVFADGDDVVQKGVDVCKIDRYRYSETPRK